MGKSKKKKFRVYSDVLKFVGCFILIGIMVMTIALLCEIIKAELIIAGSQTILEMLLVILCAVIAMFMLYPIEFIIRFIVKKIRTLKK